MRKFICPSLELLLFLPSHLVIHIKPLGMTKTIFIKVALLIMISGFAFSTASAQEVIYDNTTASNGFRMIASSEKSCVIPEEHFWASFYLIWGGNSEVGDYHLSFRYYSVTPCSMEQGGRILLTLKDGSKVSLSCDEATTSEKSPDPFVADVSYPHEICCTFTATKLQLRKIIALGINTISLELSPKEVVAKGEFKNFANHLSAMLQAVDERKATKSR